MDYCDPRNPFAGICNWTGRRDDERPLYSLLAMSS